MIRKSKHLEALIRRHWRTLLLGGASNGMWLDGYNCGINPKVSGTITTRIDAANMWFIIDNRRDEKPTGD